MNVNVDVLMSAWGWALIQFVWQGLLIGVVAAFLLRLTRNAKPQTRYAIAVLALVLCLLVPVITTLQTLSLPKSDAIATIAHTAAPVTLHALDQSTLSFRMPNSLHNQMPWINIAWLIGCVLFSMRMLLGLSWISQTQQKARFNNQPSLQYSLNQLARRFGIQRPITLLISEDIESPMTAGCWKPIIFMPAAIITHLTPEYIEALLAHELAHIKRFDYLVNLVQSGIEAILFFHPVVWWLSKHIRTERENIADDLAAQVLNNPHQLATALAALDQYQWSNPMLALAAHGGNLMSRIQRLVKPTQHIFNWKISIVLATMVLTCLAVVAQEKKPSLNKTANIQSPVSAASTDSTINTVAVDSAQVAVQPTQPANVVSVADKGSHETYAVVIAGKEGMMMSGNWDDIKNIEAIKKSQPGSFLWFKRNNKDYVIQDPKVIAQVQAAWRDTDKLSNEMEALSAKMDVHSKSMDAISDKMDAVTSHDSSSEKAMEKLDKEMEALSMQQESMSHEIEMYANKMASAKTDAERKTLDQQLQTESKKMDALSHKMEALAKLIEAESAEIEKAMQPLEVLSKEMEIAAKPMDALGKQMEVLGEQMEALSKIADQQVLSLIDQSLKNGTAIPLNKN
jgi:beta-lactamase regulating signal transducer with metallopeptidase domain/predicted  nucleic acid-binding Zn-ribbon protein